jgi:1-pyrroline-4-hydroxy-2-carboxylate deaminase
LAANPFRGCIPALMTPCKPDRTPDFDALAKQGKELIGLGMSGVVYCGSMGDWPLLSDEDRKRGVEALAQRAHFAGILEAAVDLPAVIYNSPYYGFETKADLFFDLRKQYPHLIGFKEFGGAKSLTYAAENITSGDPGLTLMVGVDTQVFHGFVNCGAKGAITGVGNALPKEVLHLIALCEQAAAGDPTARRQALELDEALRVLSTFDEGPDLVLYYKHLMVLEGHKEYELHLNPTDSLSASQKAHLEAQWRQFKAWYAGWAKG